MNKLLEPSLLAFGSDYQNTLPSLKKIGIQQIHFDIMDGKLVAHKTSFTPHDLLTIHEYGFEISVHYMGIDCLTVAQTYAQLPIKAMTFQYEVLQLHPELHSTFQAAMDVLHSHHIKCGIAFNPTTPFSTVAPWVAKSDIVTIMSVPAGAGGQSFELQALKNLDALYHYQQTTHPQLIIQIDGGVNLDNLPLFLDKVQWVVSGSSFYHYDSHQRQMMINRIQNH